MRNNLKHQKGQSLIEFVLTLPIMLLLIFVFLDFGRAIYYYSTISNAAREGGRLAIVTYNQDRSHDNEIISRVQDYSIGIDLNTAIIEISYSGDDNEFVTVEVTIEFSPVTPFLAQFLGDGNTISLSSETKMMLSPIAH